MLRPRMVMEALSYEQRDRIKCAKIMCDLFTSGKIQRWQKCVLTNKLLAIAEVDPREVMSRMHKSCRLIRVDWIEDPRLKYIKEDPSFKKWWVDPVEDLRTKWYQDITNSKWYEDPRKKLTRMMVMEMLSCDTDEWIKALMVIKKRFSNDHKIYCTRLDRDLKKLFLLGDMDPTEVVDCLRDYCRLVIVEWVSTPRHELMHNDGPQKILIPNLEEIDEEEEKESFWKTR